MAPGDLRRMSAKFRFEDRPGLAVADILDGCETATELTLLAERRDYVVHGDPNRIVRVLPGGTLQGDDVHEYIEYELLDAWDEYVLSQTCLGCIQ